MDALHEFTDLFIRERRLLQVCRNDLDRVRDKRRSRLDRLGTVDASHVDPRACGAAGMPIYADHFNHPSAFGRRPFGPLTRSPGFGSA